MSDVRKAIGAVWRIESARLVAAIARVTRDVGIAEELAQAPQVLAEFSGQPVTEVSIPFGSYDRHVLRRLREAGVTRAYTSDGGRAEPDTWLQARNSVKRTVDATTEEIADEMKEAAGS